MIGELARHEENRQQHLNVELLQKGKQKKKKRGLHL